MHLSRIMLRWQTIFSILFLCAASLIFAQNTPASEPLGASAPRLSDAAKTASPSLPEVPGLLSQDQIKDLIQKVAANDIENDKKQRDYTYTERDVENTLDGNGQTKSVETKTYEVLNIYGDSVQRLIEKNDKPLSAKDSAKEEEKIQKSIDKREKESDKDREKRAIKGEEDREVVRQVEREIADAYDVTPLGRARVAGRGAGAVEAELGDGFVAL